MLGNRTLQNHKFDTCLKMEVVDNITVPTALWKLFCDTDDVMTCDEYFVNNNVTIMQGIPGLTSGVISGVKFKEQTCWCLVSPQPNYYISCKSTSPISILLYFLFMLDYSYFFFVG